MLGAAGLGQPFGAAPGDRALLLTAPEEQVVREERPEVMKMRRGEGDSRRRGMKVWVKAWVEVTFRE